MRVKVVAQTMIIDYFSKLNISELRLWEHLFWASNCFKSWLGDDAFFMKVYCHSKLDSKFATLIRKQIVSNLFSYEADFLLENYPIHVTSNGLRSTNLLYLYLAYPTIIAPVITLSLGVLNKSNNGP